MLFAALLAVFAVAQAAAIHNSVSKHLSFLESLVERRPLLIHNYALVCLYDRAATNFCQKYYGYGCDSNARVRKVLPYDKCDAFCQCVDLNPKPACMVGLTGQSWCLRDVHQEQGQDASTTAEELSLAHRLMTTGLPTPGSPLFASSSSPTISDELSQIVQTSGSQQSIDHIEALPTNRLLAPRDIEDHDIPHNYALVCASDRQETTWCQNDGYYCDSHGKVVAGHTPNKYCSDYCTCIDVGVRKYCMLASSGAMYCLRSEAGSELESLDQIEEVSVEIDLASNFSEKLAKRSEESGPVSRAESQQINLDAPLRSEEAAPGSHNFAMVCLQDRWFTSFCGQDHGYLCTRTGSLIRLRDQPMDQQCESGCQCIDSAPKPTCILNLVGPAQCARDMYNDVAILEVDTILRNERTSWGYNNMAMTCMDDRTFTKSCQNRGYFCSSSGSLIRYGDKANNDDCDATCLCVDLHPKPACIINLIGGAQCARDIDEQDYVSNNIAVTDLDIPMVNEMSDLDTPPKMQLICLSNQGFTNWCVKDGYYCAPDGSLMQKDKRPKNQVCDNNCLCVDLHPKSRCLANTIRVVYCLRDVEDVEVFDDDEGRNKEAEDWDDSNAETIEMTASAAVPGLTPREKEAVQETNDMALVCWDDQYLTNFCAKEYGYFCDARGKLHQKEGQLTGSSCESNCRCVDLKPKPHCIFTLIGGAMCQRDVEDVVAPVNLVGADDQEDDRRNHYPYLEVGGSGGVNTAFALKSTLITSVKTPASESAKLKATSTEPST